MRLIPHVVPFLISFHIIFENANKSSDFIKTVA